MLMRDNQIVLYVCMHFSLHTWDHAHLYRFS